MASSRSEVAAGRAGSGSSSGMRRSCSRTCSRSVRGGGRSRAMRPARIRGFRRSSYARRRARHRPVGGDDDVFPQARQRRTRFEPECLPRLAIGWPSISMMSSPKLRTGALAMAVPTP